MNSRFLKIIWILLAIGAVLFGIMAAPTVSATVTDNNQTQTVIAPTLWIIPALAIIVIVMLLTVLTQSRPALLRIPMRWLRARPLLYWFLLLVYLTLAVGWWVYKEQPTNGRGLTNVNSAIYAASVGCSSFCWATMPMWRPSARWVRVWAAAN